MGKTVTVRNGTEDRRLSITPRLGEWIFATDSERTYMGDGKTPGGISVDKKHYEVATVEEIDDIEHCRDGDTCDVDGGTSVYFYINGTWVELGAKATNPNPIPEPGSGIGEWVELELDYGWSNIDSSGDKPRVRLVNGEVQIDATLKKISYSEYSPFLLPKWARPSKPVYTTIENSSGQGATSVSIFPDGTLYLRKYATRSLSRVSFNIRYFVD